MKIGIVSKYYKNYNYGGLLQSYAMVKVLEKIGIQAEQISFKPNEVKKLGFFIWIKIGLKKIVKSFIIRMKLKRIKSLDKNMKKFMKEIPHSRVVNEKNITKLNEQYDLFVAGSDQIWNPAFAYDAYFLKFADDYKRISYAASIGINDFTDEELTYLKNKLWDFESISVREQSAKKILEDILPDKKIEWVLDPTFLLSKTEWGELECSDKINLSDKYALVYLMGNDEENYKLVYKIINEMNLKMITIPFTMKEYLNDKNIVLDIGPKEFVSLIKHANVIFTDSFHATSFSIINEKSFYCLNRSRNAKKSMNTRIDNLFEMFGIESRWISCYDDYVKKKKNIDYIKVSEKLNQYKDISINFIKNSIDKNINSKERNI